MTDPRKKKRFSIIWQVALMFLLSILLAGAITYMAQRRHSEQSVRETTEKLARSVANEAMLAIKEYPAYEWLLDYWYQNGLALDIEYDVGYHDENTETEAKSRSLGERYPTIQQKYASVEEIESMSPEDQKAYAEVTYSWLITRLNEIKQSAGVDFLFGVIAEKDFEKQFFLFSAASPGAVRGTSYEEVYTLAVQVDVSEQQREAMRSAEQQNSYLVEAGNYMDYYTFVCDVDSKPMEIGITYNTTALRDQKKAQAARGTRRAMSYQLLQALLCLGMILFGMVLPLKKVQESIHLYKQTKDGAATRSSLSKIHKINEIGQLSEDVAELSTEIDDYVGRIETITKEKERIGTELSMARRIQGSMLPSVFPPFPERVEFELYASIDPAREVGGDFYDFYLVDDDHLCLTIADVSGKGVPAALFMMISKILLQSYAKIGISPAEILQRTNETICSNNEEEMFVTVWLGILEISTGRLVTANAGHEYPALRKAGGDYELVNDKHGLVIGAMTGCRYKETELTLEPGDSIFVYTDGVPEATDSNNAMFGTDAMLNTLNRTPEATPEQMLIGMREAVDAFVKEAEQFDDLTMLCLKYKGPGTERKEK